MADPVYSPDGKFIWTGTDWAPVAQVPQSLELHDTAVVGDVSLTVNNDAEAIARGVTTAVLSSMSNQTSGKIENPQQPVAETQPIIPESSNEIVLPEVSIISRDKLEVILSITDDKTSRHFKFHYSFRWAKFYIRFGEEITKVRLRRKNILKMGGNPFYRFVFENRECGYPHNDYSLEWWLDQPSRWSVKNAFISSLKIYYKGQQIFSLSD